ncbi:MAG: cytochrome c [Nitrospirota bacterium]|jgi:mono/diheme cytochrome c family protein/uncharacterized membrane protein
MPLLLYKSLLSIVLLATVLFGMFTMFEVFGKAEARYDARKIIRLHKINGVLYVILFLYIGYLCLGYLKRSQAEPSPRVALHGLLALGVFLLLLLKVVSIHFYRKYYEQAKVLGILIGLLSLAMVGVSGGYYMLVVGFGELRPPPPAEAMVKPADIVLKTDEASIQAGRRLYEDKCTFCHDPNGRETVVGPGHKGILKREVLPVSGRPATVENVVRQLQHPYRKMPSFAYLDKKQLEDIVAYLNTL